MGKQGITVLIGARDAQRGEDAAKSLQDEGIDARAITLDVTDAATIHAAAQKVEADFGRLDILINNAGIALEQGGPASATSLDTIRQTYETNVFGVVAVTDAFLPLLRKSDAGRVVNVSSSLGSLTLNTDPSWGFAAVKPLAYNSSKAALNMATVIFAAEVADTPIKINAVCPGYVATDINGHSGPRTVEQGATASVRYATLPADGPTGGFFNEDGPVAW